MQDPARTVIGYIVDVQGNVLTATLVEDEQGHAPTVTIGDEDIVVGRIGSYVAIRQNAVHIIAMVTRMTEQEALAALDSAFARLEADGVDDAAGRYFFLPHDGDPANLEETALAYSEIKQALTSLSARSLLFIDTCRAGGVWGRPGEPSTDVVRVVKDLSSPENGGIVFASSTHAQLSDNRENHVFGVNTLWETPADVNSPHLEFIHR